MHEKYLLHFYHTYFNIYLLPSMVTKNITIFKLGINYIY
jgi:hypothetical protein